MIVRPRPNIKKARLNIFTAHIQATESSAFIEDEWHHYNKVDRPRLLPRTWMDENRDQVIEDLNTVDLFN